MAEGRRISPAAFLISLTASPRATPGARLNDSVTAGTCPWWVIASGAVGGAYRVNALSGTCVPSRALTQIDLRLSGSCQYFGSTSITTWYWLRGRYIVDTWQI